MLIGNSNHNTNGLSTGAVAGITAACTMTLFVFLGLLGFLWHRHRHQSHNAGSRQQNAFSDVFSGSESTAVLVASQMTTVPNPFLSTPPPSSPHGVPYGTSEHPRKGQVRFNALREETRAGDPSDSV